MAERRQVLRNSRPWLLINDKQFDRRSRLDAPLLYGEEIGRGARWSQLALFLESTTGAEVGGLLREQPPQLRGRAAIS